jgi:hypothetical protein
MGGACSRSGEMINVYKTLVGTPEREHLGDIGNDGRIICIEQQINML